MYKLTRSGSFRRTTAAAIAASTVFFCGNVAAQGLGSVLGRQVNVGNVESAHCTALNVVAPGSADTGLRNCAIAAVDGANVALQARATAPSPYDPNNPTSYQLPAVGSSATITSVVSRLPNTLAVGGPLVTAFAGGAFYDALQLGEARPAYLDLEFSLHGSLTINTTHPARESIELNPAQAHMNYVVGAQSGRVDSMGVFSSFAPFAIGSVSVDRYADSLGLAPATNTSSTILVGDVTHNAVRSDPLGDPSLWSVRVRLGAEFFSNLDNDVLRLGISLNTFAAAPARFYYDGPPGEPDYVGEVSADFANTFSMVALTAYDANGVDVTAGSILGFVGPSITPVPEPTTLAMMLAGLGLFVALKRRHR